MAGEILSNLTLPNTANVVYRINGRVDIGRDVTGAGNAGQSATLTVDPGVRLFGDEVDDVLIINRGSRILANGSPSQPIIVTSREDILNTADPTTSSRQWAGLILLGRAPIRGCDAAVTQGSVDCENEIEGITLATGRAAKYGGATPADSSGSLQYVQIRYPGAFLPSGRSGDDLNGLSLGGVGSGTTIDHVQIHNSGDDGVEIFGGKVNLRHLIVTGAQDDSIDCDEGWDGSIQFAVVRQTSRSASEPDKLVECSNRTVASLSGTTVTTNPTIANFTFVSAPGTGVGIDFNNSSGTPGA
ncbi:MAG: hypothetical protein GC189_14285, partial [Alphaproteobacteria bacterium]|nr:hypothetical protein [Alphaproteobacteria bacterium]